MGSCNNYSRLTAFHEKFKDKVVEHYKSLIGATITEINDFTLDYYKKADVTLDNGQVLEVHFGWSSEEEESEGEEILEEGEISSIEYFNEYLKDQKIIKIETGYDRDDSYYAYAIVDEAGNNIEIPIDFDVVSFELRNCSFISDEEFEQLREEYFSDK